MFRSEREKFEGQKKKKRRNTKKAPESVRDVRYAPAAWIILEFSTEVL